ncbi:MAG: Membrane-bound lytic murein transglycosylase D precursor [Syntrophus sp. PtaB.Bin001]|nr:MAG: Membrane-bound lytic murein transglycosylase D precursor [Syntrophus sp. PtaB.Bin001]
MKKSTPLITIFIILIFISLFLTGFAIAQAQEENESKNVKVSKKQISLSQQNFPHKLDEKKVQKAIVSDDDFDEEEKEDDRDLMEEALTYLNQSQKLWEKGDIEKALELLDQAYTLILETDGDMEIARQKDDLRLLISKRIMAIYSSIQTTTKGKRSEIPIVMNPDVEREIKSFQTCEKDFFVQSYQRSYTYRPAILKELKKAGLPEELSWLPLVESGFKIGALSKARALGLWQFIPSTGYKFGLNRDEWVDERMDADKSTRAAISYLKELHGMFGDWLTVLAAYNSGEGRVMRVISRQHINYLDRFWDLYHQLPSETARYVPRFLATLHIIRNPEKYGFDLKTDIEQKIPYEFKTVKSNKPMKLQDISFYTGISEDVLNCLNSELRHRMTPDKEYELKLPSEAADRYSQIVDQIPQCEIPSSSFILSNRGDSKQERMVERRTSRSASISYKIKRGESLNSIARKYKISPRMLRAYNNISSKQDLKAGRRLNIPIENTNKLTKRSLKFVNGDKDSKDGDNQISYKIKKGDSLASLAKKFGTSESEIRKLNNIKGRSLKLGKVIKISRDEDENSETDHKKEGKKKIKRKISMKPIEKTYISQRADRLYNYHQEIMPV